MAKKIYYKIGEACKNLDIQPYVLRYWETEFPMLRPDKSSSGQRVYTDKDLAVIRRIKELLYDEGYTIAGAKKKLESDSERPGPRAVPDAEEDEKKEGKAEKAAKEGKSEPAEEKKAEKPAAKAKGKKATAKKATAKKAAKKGKASAEKEPDAADPKELAALRKGVRKALDEARAILDLLDSKSSKR